MCCTAGLLCSQSWPTFRYLEDFPCFIWAFMPSPYFSSSSNNMLQRKEGNAIYCTQKCWRFQGEREESGLGWQGWSFSQRCTGNVIVFNNLSLMITHTLMMVSRGLCLCALTPSAGETGDRDLMQSVVGQTWNRVPPRLQRRVVYLFCSRQQHKQTT